MTDRERLLALLNALDASETALRRDPPIRGWCAPRLTGQVAGGAKH
jgi:hypothetical protein